MLCGKKAEDGDGMDKSDGVFIAVALGCPANGVSAPTGDEALGGRDRMQSCFCAKPFVGFREDRLGFKEGSA